MHGSVIVSNGMRMPSAWVLINTEVGSEGDVFKDLQNIAEVQEIYMTYGVHDIIARVTADTMDRLKETITANVRKVKKLKTTLTMLVAQE
jgi:DNA-binding Lrp family transcriptional regulator